MNPYISPAIPAPSPIWMTVSDINSVGSFFVFLDAAIKCHPIVLVLSGMAGFLFVYLLSYVFSGGEKNNEQ